MDSPRQWLEMELTRQLRPVSAPEFLWNRIHEKHSVRGALPTGWVLWPVLALLMIFASGDLVWQMARSRGTLRHLAQVSGRQLRIVTSATPACDFWSSDPEEIRNWVKTKGNMDVDVPAPRAGNDSLVGVKLVRAHGKMVAAMAYRAGDGEGALLVSDLHAACLTCHVKALGQM